MTTFRIALYGRESLPSVTELEMLFSWHVIRAKDRHEAIGIAIAAAGTPADRWKWAFLKWGPNKTTGSKARIDAIRIVGDWRTGRRATRRQ